MKTVLTGIQSSGIPHLGNLLGAIIPAIDFSKNEGYNCLYFIADYHSLTTNKNKDLLQENIYAVTAAWQAFGLDTNTHIFFKQSDVIEVMELAWVLNCFTPYPMLANAHSFKEKKSNLADVNGGLFTYPVLQAADIILYDADLVPVGNDQKQHIEMARDIAVKFNQHYGVDFFVPPEPVISEIVMTIPGIDGRKMSKSYGNIIDIFLPEKQLKKQINSIVTDTTPLEKPKNPDSCSVFAIFSLLAESAAVEKMRQNYLAGNYGYGHAKTELFELIMDKYSNQRHEFTKLMNDKTELRHILSFGASKARAKASMKIKEMRTLMGYELKR